MNNVQELATRIRAELAKALVGQAELVDRLLIGLLTGGHLLIEGVPGVAKTLAARSLAKAVGIDFHRIQFTPDLLPADLIGSEVFDPRQATFYVRQGPIFAQIVLADEINRAPAKVQSALLEAMQERRVTIGDQTFDLPAPFLVLATQNPVEHEGTYPLPEAQLDRFLMKVVVGYPTRAEEAKIVCEHGSSTRTAVVETVAHAAELLEACKMVDAVHVEEKIVGYVLDLVRATRNVSDHKLEFVNAIELGASPRAAIALVQSARANAALAGRDFVLPQDVRRLAKDVLRHRIALSFDGEAEGWTPDRIVDSLLESLVVP